MSVEAKMRVFVGRLRDGEVELALRNLIPNARFDRDIVSDSLNIRFPHPEGVGGYATRPVSCSQDGARQALCEILVALNTEGHDVLVGYGSAVRIVKTYRASYCDWELR